MARFLRHLNPSLKLLAGAVTALASLTAAGAEALDTVIAPQFGTIYLNETRRSSSNTTTSIRGYRYAIRVDFMSLSNHVSFNVVSALGGRYSDYGIQVRIFDLLQMGRQSSSGIYYGAGAGFSYSPGYIIDEIETRTPFIDTVLTAFLRFQWDTTAAWGLFSEVAYEGVLNRHLQTDPALESPGSTHRFVVGVGVPFEVDL